MEYAFDAMLKAVIRVQAGTESDAREKMELQLDATMLQDGHVSDDIEVTEISLRLAGKCFEAHSK